MRAHSWASRAPTAWRGAWVSRTAGSGSGKTPTATSRSRAPPSEQLPAADTARYANGDGPERKTVPGTAGSSSVWRGGSCKVGAPTPRRPWCRTCVPAEDDIEVDQTSLAAPLDGRVESGAIAGDRDLVCLVRFRFRNVGRGQARGRAPSRISSNSGRSPGAYGANRRDGSLSDWLVPQFPTRDTLERR